MQVLGGRYIAPVPLASVGISKQCSLLDLAQWEFFDADKIATQVMGRSKEVVSDLPRRCSRPHPMSYVCLNMIDHRPDDARAVLDAFHVTKSPDNDYCRNEQSLPANSATASGPTQVRSTGVAGNKDNPPTSPEHSLTLP